MCNQYFKSFYTITCLFVLVTNVIAFLSFFYPLANEVAKGYSNATVCPSVASL